MQYETESWRLFESRKATRTKPLSTVKHPCAPSEMLCDSASGLRRTINLYAMHEFAQPHRRHGRRQVRHIIEMCVQSSGFVLLHHFVMVCIENIALRY